MTLSRKSLIAVGSGALTALPALAWAGNQVWDALKATERIPVIEERVSRGERELRETREILLEMLMLQHRQLGSERRAEELERELEALKRKEGANR